MCDYSLELTASRPAKVGEKLVSTTFPHTFTRGFAAADDKRNVAVCLLPGTELAFTEDVAFIAHSMFARRCSTGHKVARFREVNQGYRYTHHDALEFPDGQIVLLTQLCEGQLATVLQLPASEPRVSTKEPQRQESSAVL